MSGDAINLLAALAAFGAAVGTGAAALLSYLLLRRSTDPDVIVYTEQDPIEPRFLYIIIENVGSGTAMNIDFKLSHKLSHEIVFFPKKLTGAFDAGIPMLPPRAKRKYIWGDFRSVMDHLEGRRVVCEVTFYGRLYFLPIEKAFENTCIIEAESYRDSVDEGMDANRELTRAVRDLREAIVMFGPILRSFQEIGSALRDVARQR